MARSSSDSEDYPIGEELVAQIAWSDASLDCEVCQRQFATPPDDWTEATVWDWAQQVAREATNQGWIAETYGPYARVVCPACAKTYLGVRT
jgi:hypothetical protein